MPINEISIKAKLQNAIQGKRFEPFIRNAANTRFVFARADLMEDIDESKVSKDIIEACNDPSTTQEDIISKGNVAAAIGFYKGAEPIEDLKQFLFNNIRMSDKAKITLQKSRVNFAFKIIIPSKTEIYQKLPKDVGPNEWTTRSWLDMIENGIPYLAKYIFWSEGFKNSNSRSGTGLQTKGQIQNKAVFTPQENYLSDIFDRFKEKFEK